MPGRAAVRLHGRSWSSAARDRAMRQSEDLRDRLVPQPGLDCLVQTLCRLPPRTPGEAALRRQNAAAGWLRNRKHDGTSARCDRFFSPDCCACPLWSCCISAGRTTMAPAPMAAVSQSSTLTVSLLLPRSQREPPQMLASLLEGDSSPAGPVPAADPNRLRIVPCRIRCGSGRWATGLRA